MKTASVGTAPGRVSGRVSGRKCFQTPGDERPDAELGNRLGRNSPPEGFPGASVAGNASRHWGDERTDAELYIGENYGEK